MDKMPIHFFEDRTKVKILFDIQPPLIVQFASIEKESGIYIIYDCNIAALNGNLNLSFVRLSFQMTSQGISKVNSFGCKT